MVLKLILALLLVLVLATVFTVAVAVGSVHQACGLGDQSACDVIRNNPLPWPWMGKR